MRSTPLALTVVAVAACGGKAATTSSPAPAPTALGTTGFPGLDWDATEATVRATTAGELQSWKTTHGGEAAEVFFEFTGDGGLAAISVNFDRGFTSMNTCGETFATVRAALAPRLGDSTEDNLAAYWDHETYSAILSCGIADDGEAATMSMSYRRPEQ